MIDRTLSNVSSLPLLMGGSLTALRAKLTREGSPLAAWWRHFVTNARRDPEFFAPYTVLTALVTGDPADRELARQAFMRFVELQGEGMVSNEAQFHTHVLSAQLARWAIFYDWIADEGILSVEEDAAFRAYLLDYGQQFSWQQTASRARSIDNQAVSNAFGAAVVGYLLGVRRGESPTARRVFRTGLDRLRYYLNHLPAGGYLGEGSTYQENVVLPVTLLASLFVKTVTGEDTPGLRPLLDLCANMVAPDGLMPPWDDYGFTQASVKSGLAYLARITGDPNPLAVMRAGDIWYRTALPAWELDDRLWTLVFWPDEEPSPAPARYPAWMTPEVGGALQSAGARLRLFQYWDECGGVPNSGRSQVNPNAISLELDGSPLLLDGRGDPEPDPIKAGDAEMVAYVGQRTLEAVKEYAFSCWGARISDEDALQRALGGNIGQSNSLVLDEEYWYVPHTPCRGTGEALHHAGPLQVLRSEAAAYYRDRYDVRSVCRSTLLAGARYLLVSDVVQADTPHTLTWQAFLRQEARLEEGRVHLETPERVQCEVIPLQPGRTELLPTGNFPAKLGDGRSAIFRHTAPAATSGRLDVVLVPLDGSELLADLSEGWLRDVDGAEVDLREAYLTDTCSSKEARRYRRAFRMAPEAGRRYFLRIEAAGNGVELRVNDRLMQVGVPQDKGSWPGSAECLPRVFEITDALGDGENRLELLAPFFHGESVLGPVRLSAGIEHEPASVEALGGAAFRVSLPEGEEWLLSDNRAGLVQWAGGETDARYALRTSVGEVAAAAVSRLELPEGVRLLVDSPCDIAWSALETQVTRWVENSTIQLCWAGGELRMQTGGCLDIVYHGDAPYCLRLTLPTPQSVTVNGVGQGMLDKGERMLTLEPAASEAAMAGRLPASSDEVYALLRLPREMAAQIVNRLLRAENWRLQAAAADVAGLLQLTECVPALLDRFAEGEQELPYPPLQMWWRASKMLRNAGAQEGDDPAAPRPLAEKRWRVKRAAVTALGKIGDVRAVAPLEAAMRRCTDFFPVTAQLTAALGRLGAPSSIAVLELFRNHAEYNTQVNARHALALLLGEISRAEFEARVGVG